TVIYLYVAGEVLEVTPEHPFLVNGEWLTADKLTTYHSLTLHDGTTTPIEKIETITLATPKKVYNFAVQGYNSYFVGESRVLVHNCEVTFNLKKATNKTEGIRRENTVGAVLEDVHGKDNVLKERMLLDEFGNKVPGPNGKGRRVDFVVTDGSGNGVGIEVTSKTANKKSQAANEKAIRANGGNYVKDSNGNLINTSKTKTIRIK
ncbi:polymorphic toxin-type HINT domain-containing protein, partial [Flavobacterium branchiophilum]